MKRAIFTTPQEVEAAFYEAFEKADLDAMMAVWADDDDIVCVHPGGIRLSGMAQVRESWRQIFAGTQTLRFRLRNQQSLNGMTLAVHSAYEQVSVAGEAQARAPVVATNIYMRTENGWRMVVHHASPAPVSPDAEAKRAPKTLH
ncbi:MAG: nuclear transport factor 2 family protein [Pseudomonadota bacterium]